ncbi:Signal recognition particle subunit SRP68 [Taenia crassiceps]|uniref:Signal recognition particle subunit SRP68 n=1 Tax=Taenia crassiceps TaxID=6207 RepID=A0ABR4QE46_9CEST
MVVVSEASVGIERRDFNIPVLYITKCAQNQHGLRHGDYQRYRQYVARKIRRMRKSLRFQQGTRSRVVPKKLTPETVTDTRYLVLAVFEIERCWAYAMQLRAEANSEPRKRFHMLSRLRKAAKNAQVLNEIMANVPMCSAQTKLELTAYIQWINGVLHFEKQDWMKAKDLLESAQQIYTGLASSVDEDLQAIYAVRTGEILPQIRYCAYSIGDTSAANELREMRAGVEGILAEEQLDELLKQMQALQVGSVTEVTWLGATIPVKLEKARLAVLALQEADEQLAKLPSSFTKATICESTLRVIVDALVAVREEIRWLSNPDTVASAGLLPVQTSQKANATGIEKLPRLQRLNIYLQYSKLNKTIWRTLYQLETLISNVASEHHHTSWNLVTSGYHKPHEFARLYDTVVQNLQEVLTLPGGIQDNADVRALIKAKIVAYQALRCYYLALAYLRNGRFLESSSLLQRCQAKVGEAEAGLLKANLSDTTEAEAVPGHSRPILLQLLRDLADQIGTEMLACKAGYMLELADGGTSGESVDDATVSADIPRAVLKEPLIRSPGEFVPEKVILRKLTTQPAPLVPFPLEFEAIPVKPTFFDLALNHINFPTQPTKESTPAGITGFMKGLIWGQSKK